MSKSFHHTDPSQELIPFDCDYHPVHVSGGTFLYFIYIVVGKRELIKISTIKPMMIALFSSILESFELTYYILPYNDHLAFKIGLLTQVSVLFERSAQEIL